jgi:hypothetical protein
MKRLKLLVTASAAELAEATSVLKNDFMHLYIYCLAIVKNIIDG